MTLTAKYPGTCPECTKPWTPDTYLRYDADGRLVHDRCPETLHGTVCPTHHLQRSLSGTCAGCEEER